MYVIVMLFINIFRGSMEWLQHQYAVEIPAHFLKMTQFPRGKITAQSVINKRVLRIMGYHHVFNRSAARERTEVLLLTKSSLKLH